MWVLGVSKCPTSFLLKWTIRPTSPSQECALFPHECHAGACTGPFLSCHSGTSAGSCVGITSPSSLGHSAGRRVRSRIGTAGRPRESGLQALSAAPNLSVPVVGVPAARSVGTPCGLQKRKKPHIPCKPGEFYLPDESYFQVNPIQSNNYLVKHHLQCWRGF